MNVQFDFSSNYELGILVEEGPQYQVYHAFEKSLHAPCHYHKVMLGIHTADSQWQAARVVLRNYANLIHPRTPRLADAWFAQDYMVAIDYRTAATPFDQASNNPFAYRQDEEEAYVFEWTLDLLAAVHASSIVHGQLQPRSFGLGKMNKVYLMDTGLDTSLTRCFASAGSDDTLVLSTNLYSRDLALWAFHMLSLKCRDQFLPFDVVEKWDDYHFRKSGEKLRSMFRREPVIEFFVACLAGFGGGPIRYDTASEALDWWRKKEMRSLFV